MSFFVIPHRHRSAGFTLLEMAIVLVIMGLLLGTGLTVLNAKIEQQKLKDTQKILDDAREALIGFAIANGRLPCPATTVNGQESPVGGGACTRPYDGFLPAATLGIPGQDSGGYITDAWQTPANRIRYAVSTASTSAATTTDGIRSKTMGTFASSNEHLRVCASASGASASSCGPAANALTSNAVAVIFSAGKNAARGGAGTDEAANHDANAVFVFHTPAARTAPNGEFDDHMTWLPSTILFNRMIQAGRLP